MGRERAMPVLDRLGAPAEALAVLAGAAGKPLEGHPGPVLDVLSLLGVDHAVTALTSAEAEFVNGLATTILLQAVSCSMHRTDPQGGHTPTRISCRAKAPRRRRWCLSCGIDPPRPRRAGRPPRPARSSILGRRRRRGRPFDRPCAAPGPRCTSSVSIPFDAALKLARRSVTDEGLGGCIELRSMGEEQLGDVDAFDLVWFSLPVAPDAVLDAALDAACRSLRPGGWFLTGTLGGAGELGMALARLRTARAGGRLVASAAIETLLVAHGLTNVRSFSPGRWGPGTQTVGRRPLD